MEEIVFFYPSKTVGGAEFSIIHFAKELIQIGHKVSVIDYEDGFIIKALTDTPVQLIPYRKDIPFSLPASTTCLIITAMVPTRFDQMIVRGNPKVLIHSMHALSFLSRYPGLDLKNITPHHIASDLKRLFPTQFETLQHYLNTLTYQKGLIFTEGNNLALNQKIFNLEVDSDDTENTLICPAPCAETLLPKLLDYEKPLRKDRLDIAWVGRLSLDKVESILYVLKNLDRYLQDKPIQARFHIIGEGSHANRLTDFLCSSKIELILTGSLVKQELDYYLKHNADILFAMGLSVLDGAKLKIPAVLLDTSLAPIDLDYKLSWLFESKNFLVGEYVANHTLEHRHSFQDILDAIYSQGCGKDYGEKCYQHFMQYHSVKSITKRLLASIQRCNNYYSDFAENNYFKIRISMPVSAG